MDLDISLNRKRNIIRKARLQVRRKDQGRVFLKCKEKVRKMSRNVVVGVTGGIACYKAADVVSRLKKKIQK